MTNEIAYLVQRVTKIHAQLNAQLNELSYDDQKLYRELCGKHQQEEDPKQPLPHYKYLLKKELRRLEWSVRAAEGEQKALAEEKREQANQIAQLTKENLLLKGKEQDMVKMIKRLGEERDEYKEEVKRLKSNESRGEELQRRARPILTALRNVTHVLDELPGLKESVEGLGQMTN